MKKIMTAAFAAACSLTLLTTGCSSSNSSAQTSDISTQEAQSQEPSDPARENETSTASGKEDTDQTASAVPEETSDAEDLSADGQTPQGQTADGQAADGQTPQGLSAFRIYGPVTHEGDSLVIDNQSDVSSPGEIVLHLSETTQVLDAVNGYPLSVDSIQDGDLIYVYISPAMTMSLPPQTSALMIFAEIPEDFQVPDYLTVESLTATDGGYELTAADGSVFTIPSDCAITPYLTRQVVRLEDLKQGSTCVLWSDETLTASKIVLFN